MKLSQMFDINLFSFEKSHLMAVSIQSVEMSTVENELLKINLISFKTRQVVYRNLREAVQWQS